MEPVSTNCRECLFCCGSGLKTNKVRVDGRTCTLLNPCRNCEGKGIIYKTQRKNIDGSYRSKTTSSFQSFKAGGLMPLNSQSEDLIPLPNEDLSCLVGEWKIFQKIGCHRYSTDDLVTSWLAVRETKIFHTKPACIDIGCGIGSVLLMNAWQLPDSVCYGVELQRSRYEQAARSVYYNVGAPQQQSRVKLFNCDLRDPIALEKAGCDVAHFDLITGTPPYFNPQDQLAQPACPESLGCLFEMCGNIFDYCAAASRLMRMPRDAKNDGTNESLDGSPSIFAVCHAALRAVDTYKAASAASLTVLRRVDVVPREGKPPLFCVFLLTAMAWIRSAAIASHYPQLHQYSADPCSSGTRCSNEDDLVAMIRQCQERHPQPSRGGHSAGRLTGSVYGEVCETLTVRTMGGQHSAEYAALLRSLGKPSSLDRETFEHKSSRVPD